MTNISITEPVTQYKASISNRSYREKYQRWLLESSKKQNKLIGNEFQEGNIITLYDNNGNELATRQLSTYFQLSNVDIITFGFDNLTDDIANRAEYIVKTESIPSTTNLNNQVVCPKCGSTQIQIVRRNYSFLTGFMTNKVDRVCANCKHKF